MGKTRIGELIEEKLAARKEGAPAPVEQDVKPDVTPQTPEECQAAIQKLNEAHTAALEALGDRLKSDIGQIITQQAHLEQVEREQNEQGLAGRLTEVLAARAKEQKDDEAIAEAAKAAGEGAEKAEEDALRARVAPALASADEAMAACHKWSSVHLSHFNDLARADRDELLQGQPSLTSREQQASVGLAAEIERLVTDTLLVYQNFLDTQRQSRAEIGRLIKHGRHMMSAQEFKRQLNQATHEIAMASLDTVEMLKGNTRGVTAMLERLAERRASVKGVAQPEIQFTDKQGEMERTQKAEAMTAVGSESGSLRRTTAVVDEGFPDHRGGN
jgi:hypothetical protein